MAKIIGVHVSGNVTKSINVDNVLWAEPNGEQCKIYFVGEVQMNVTDTYETISHLMAS